MGLYRTVFETEVAEIEVKKSKFIAEIRHIETNEEALSVIKELKKKYYDASHNCFAYILREDEGVRHSSDDGEPSGTAGKPMLDVLAGMGLSDIIVVVTRYFGGTLLGTGGLVRAYSGAVKEVLEQADVVEIKEGLLVTFSIDYATLPKIVYLCKELEVEVLETLYLEAVGLKLIIDPEKYGKFLKEITDLTSGEISENTIENKKEVYYYRNKIGDISLV